MKAVPPARPIEAVGRIRIPGRAFRHYFVKEALALGHVLGSSSPEKVIGTANEGAPSVQLYGCAPNVSRHSDRKGVIYFTPLNLRFSKVFVETGRIPRSEREVIRAVVKRLPGGPAVAARLERGVVYRLWDFAWHWTIDSAPVVCLFVGVYPEASDQRAVGLLQHGAQQLAEGSRRAPRVSDGFRVPASWECWVEELQSGKYRMMPLDQAERDGRLVIRCAHCEAPAYQVDRHHPYHTEYDRCRAHLAAE